MKIFFNPTAPQNEGRIIPVPDADHGTGFTVILATKPGTEVHDCFSVVSEVYGSKFTLRGLVDQVVYTHPSISGGFQAQDKQLQIANYTSSAFGWCFEQLAQDQFLSPEFLAQIKDYVACGHNTLYVPSIQSPDPDQRALNRAVCQILQGIKCRAEINYYGGQANRTLTLIQQQHKIHHSAQIWALQNGMETFTSPEDEIDLSDVNLSESITRRDFLKLSSTRINGYRIETDRLQAVRDVASTSDPEQYMAAAIAAGSLYTRIEAQVFIKEGLPTETIVYMHKL